MNKTTPAAVYAILVFGTFTLQSCKDKPAGSKSDSGGMVTDSVPPEGMYSAPVTDTTVVDKDTIIGNNNNNVTGDRTP
ncbi:hypothetical protein ACLI1A_07915 [Flavobacterium sp. RHBU_3]|uniref:hypothetical protein n=1 Tax=Flavobacterium sp. RHBU_3 TaxID=3391184 RepID=UPI003984A1FF